MAFLRFSEEVKENIQFFLRTFSLIILEIIRLNWSKRLLLCLRQILNISFLISLILSKITFIYGLLFVSLFSCIFVSMLFYLIFSL